MADVNDNTKNFIDQLSQGNNDEAGEAFKAALRDKVANSLDNARKELAGNMFKAPEAEDFSDPKPEIADPGVFNADGSVSATPTDANKKDGKAELELTPEAENADKQDS
tara:strand:- start:134 stop:460 length:327 start_codon:yes stop_codon:yes gene_type:complete